MKKPYVTVLLCFTCLLLLFSGCTKNDDTVVIRILSSTITENLIGDYERQLSEEFMSQHPNVKIDYIGVPANDLLTKITAMSTGNDMPDVFSNLPTYMEQLSEMAITTNLHTLYSDNYLSGFSRQLLNEASISSKLEFLPWNFTPCVLIYRADLFKEKLLTPPDTWENFLDCAEKLTEDLDGDGIIDRYGFALIATNNNSGWYRFSYFLKTFGVEDAYQDTNGTWKTDIGSEQSIKAFTFYTDLALKYKVVAPGCTTVDPTVAIDLMASDKATMFIANTNAVFDIYSQNPMLKGKLGLTVLPKDVKNFINLGSNGYSIYNRSKHADIASQYLEFLCEKTNSVQLYTHTGRIPARNDACNEISNIDPSGGFQKLYNFIDNTDNFAAPAFIADVRKVLGDSYEILFTGKENDVTKVILNAQKSIESILFNK